MAVSLAHLYDHFCLLCTRLIDSDLNTEEVQTKIITITSLLESAVNLRAEIEFRRARQKNASLTFFEKIGFLLEKGIDVRSKTWSILVEWRAYVVHEMVQSTALWSILAEMLQEHYGKDDLRESLKAGMEDLKKTMKLICLDNNDLEEIWR